VSQFEEACALADVPVNGALGVVVGGVDVAVVRTDDEVFAIHDECSHANIQLSEGDVEGCLIECWLHGSTFDLRTGKPTTLPAFEPVPVYPVRVDGDDVLVDVENPMNKEEIA
jgi:3-phenylpropionate/trans-cinnamate dioxygenase ferredoxin subunit